MTTFVYDRAGRTITKNEPAPDGPGENPDATLRRITQYTYDRHKVSISVSASNGCPTPNACMSMSRTSNAMGQMMETVDAMSGKTQYWNNSAGHPVAIRDAALKVTTAVYNALGHRTALSDPNMGPWTFSYNALGEMRSQTDARGAITTINQRDALGRVLSQGSTVTLAMGLSTETIQDLYQYDPANAIGAPFKITRKRNELQVWEEQYKYDDAARPEEIRATMQGESLWTTAFQYDIYYGREKGRTYASGLIVRTEYTKYGAQSRLSNALTDQQYSRVMNGDAWGNTTREEYGNGVVGEYQFNIRTGQNQNRRWLVGGSVPQDELKYTYDNLGNLSSQKRTRSVTDALETYQYDQLQRLTQTTRSLNGAGAVSVNYAYDAVGNLKKKTDFSSNSDTAYQYTHTGPNQVSAVTLAGGGTASYTYDQNGNLTGGNLRQAAYDAGNMLKRTQFGSQIAEFEYAPTGQRYRGATSGETSYYGPAGLERTTIGGVSSWRHELGSAIVVRENGVDKTSYVARDRLGSVVAIMEAGVAVPQYRSYDAFGQARNGDFSPRAGGTLNLRPTTLRGFTEHEHVDEVQLIHMNGRAYDYQLGRFLSVDPFIQFPENSQSLNPYSYLMNNPMSGADPSGYCQTLPGSRICDPRAEKKAFLAKDAVISGRFSAQLRAGQNARGGQLAQVVWRSQSNAAAVNQSANDVQSSDQRTGGGTLGGMMLMGLLGATRQEYAEMVGPGDDFGLNLTAEDFLNGARNGLWGEARAMPGYSTNGETKRAGQIADSVPDPSDAEVISDVRYRQFLAEVGPETASAAIKIKGEKFFAMAIRPDGQVVVTRIAVFVGLGGSISRFIKGAGAVAHIHYFGLVQPPNRGDHTPVKFGDISSFVLGYDGRKVWEVGRVNGKLKYRLTPSGVWHRYTGKPEKN